MALCYVCLVKTEPHFQEFPHFQVMAGHKRKVYDILKAEEKHSHPSALKVDAGPGVVTAHTGWCWSAGSASLNPGLSVYTAL